MLRIKAKLVRLHCNQGRQSVTGITGLTVILIIFTHMQKTHNKEVIDSKALLALLVPYTTTVFNFEQ